VRTHRVFYYKGKEKKNNKRGRVSKSQNTPPKRFFSRPCRPQKRTELLPWVGKEGGGRGTQALHHFGAGRVKELLYYGTMALTRGGEEPAHYLSRRCSRKKKKFSSHSSPLSKKSDLRLICMGREELRRGARDFLDLAVERSEVRTSYSIEKKEDPGLQIHQRVFTIDTARMGRKRSTYRVCRRTKGEKGRGGFCSSTITAIVRGEEIVWS